MGIRFFCPNGHKLNVKSFLAGKRGICPHCGAKFDIPSQSATTAPPPIAPASVPAPEPLAVGGPATPHVKPPTKTKATPNEAMESQTGPTRPTGAATSSIPAVVSVVHLADRAVGGQATDGAGPVVPVVLAPVATSATEPDPIAEAPTAVWYVRTTAGGQFGPAPGDVMRQWLLERRVGADCLVWREGWPEWKKAPLVFSRLGAAMPWPAAGSVAEGHPPIPSSPRFEDDWVDAIIESKPAALQRHRPKSQQNNLMLAISFVVILLGAILAIVLIITVWRQSREEEPPTTDPATPAATDRAWSGQRGWTASGARI
jgi:uncharacterized protein DUF4339